MNRTKTKKTGPITVTRRQGGAHYTTILNDHAAGSARIYAETISIACKRRKINPRAAVIDTDDYPELMRSSMVEFAIGWIHGCAEAHGVLAEGLWDAIAGAPAATKARAA